MQSKHARLDRFISARTGIKRHDVKRLLAQGRIVVDGNTANDAQQRIGEFNHISLDGQVLQANTACYIMLNKPGGVASATKDSQHPTVIDLLDHPLRLDLHIVGRLDFNSTGLLLLTNDGRWSRRITSPDNKISKCYRVTLEDPVTPEYITAFSQGMYFSYENLTTQAAELKIISEKVTEVSLTEGRYHQIKRMFGRFQNRVTQLHRLSIGNLWLDDHLAAGQSRELTASEVAALA